MKKIFIPVKASERLPEEPGSYFGTSNGYRTCFAFYGGNFYDLTTVNKRRVDKGEVVWFEEKEIATELFLDLVNETFGQGCAAICKERYRQVHEEGWMPEHDDEHEDGDLSNAASVYAMSDEARQFIDKHWGNDQWLNLWPFDLKWLKFSPENRPRELEKAGALVCAEYDRLKMQEGGRE